MSIFAICFCAGVFSLLQLRSLPADHFWILLSACVFAFRFRYFRIITYVLLGFLWGWFRAGLVLSNDLAIELEGQTVNIQGIVKGLPERTHFGERIILKPSQDIIYKNKIYPVPRLIRISSRQALSGITPGSVISCHVKLKRPHGFYNPGAFDYEYWMLSQGIRATAYVSNEHGCIRLSQYQTRDIHTIRHTLRDALLEFSFGNDGFALMNALLVGDRTFIEQQQWSVLKKTGTNHLIAISGLHISLVFLMAYSLSNILLKLLPFIFVYFPAQKISMMMGLIAASLYSGLAGFSLPTQRALIMLSVTVLALLLNCKISLRSVLSISLFIVIAIDPFSILSPGFWLSFAAVSIIFYGLCYRVNNKSLWWQWGRAQYLVALGLFPIVFYWFQVTAPLGIIANIIAIPIVSFIVVPCILFFSISYLVLPELARLSLSIAQFNLDLLWQYLLLIERLSVYFSFTASSSLVSVMLAMSGIAWILLPRGFPAKPVAVLLLLPMFYLNPGVIDEGSFEMHVLDVGQGTATIVKTANHTLLYDTGPKYSPDFNAGEAIIMPVLKNMGNRSIDTIVVSHGDNDHIGGLKSLYEQFPVTKILYNPLPGEEQPNLPYSPCLQNQSWEWDGVNFEILHPRINSELTGLNRNQSSCVVRVSNHRHTILLTGDIDWQVEMKLVNYYSDHLAADIILVPHHGSLSSSSETFLDQVRPKFAVFTSGYRNRFGFPKQGIIARYQKRNIRFFNTAESGMVSFFSQSDDWLVEQYREKRPRFWHTKTIEKY